MGQGSEEEEMRILVIHGPNLNLLGKREKETYGDKGLEEINSILQSQAADLGAELSVFQSNSEGSLIDFIQREAPNAAGIIVNPGALTHYGLSLRDALEDAKLPVIELHLSNIYGREDFRQRSVIAPVAKGQISGLGWRGYIAALRLMVAELKGEVWA
jgi:3-dehydroquinate dehydratase-2